MSSWITDVHLDPWARAGIVVVASILIARLLEIVSSRILARLASRTATELDDQAIRILRRPIFLTVILAGLGMAATTLATPPHLETFTLSALKTVGVLVWLGAVFSLANLLLDPSGIRQARFRFLDARTVPLFNNLLKIVAVGVSAYLLIVAWHIDATAWLASAGIVGIAVGFAAKDTLANLFSGVFILADAPYRVGDFIRLDAGERGEVQHIGLRSTRILTRDDIEVTIPNAVIGNAKIVNESGGRWSRERLQVSVGVAYGSDIDRVREVLADEARRCELVCTDPEPLVRFRAFGESGLDIDLLVWIQEPVLRGRTLDALNTAVYKRFAVEGIEIPYPKRDVYIKEMPAPRT